jgi:hypothetical protein
MEGGKTVDVPFGADKWEERLRCLFDSIVERLQRRMAILTEDLVLGEEDALCEREEKSNQNQEEPRSGNRNMSDRLTNTSYTTH